MPWDLPCTADTLETLKQRITAPMRHYSNAQTGPLKTGALAESKESKQPGITTGVRSEDAGRCWKHLFDQFDQFDLILMFLLCLRLFEECDAWVKSDSQTAWPSLTNCNDLQSAVHWAPATARSWAPVYCAPLVRSSPCHLLLWELSCLAGRQTYLQGIQLPKMMFPFLGKAERLDSTTFNYVQLIF